MIGIVLFGVVGFGGVGFGVRYGFEKYVERRNREKN